MPGSGSRRPRPRSRSWDRSLPTRPELFAVGDEVYYAGSIAGSGSNAGLQLVDERVIGHKPSSLDFAEAAALPLTTITAWEALFDKLGLERDATGTLLVLGAAGGVGSMVVQLARRLTGLTVIATASRPESIAWARDMGAHHVVDHHRWIAEVRRVAPGGVDDVFTPFSTGNVDAFAEVLKAHGAVVAIDDPEGLDLLALKTKSITWHWEFMFTRPLHEPESTYQHELLDEASRLVDAGILRTTLTARLSPSTRRPCAERTDTSRVRPRSARSWSSRHALAAPSCPPCRRREP